MTPEDIEDLFRRTEGVVLPENGDEDEAVLTDEERNYRIAHLRAVLLGIALPVPYPTLIVSTHHVYLPCLICPFCDRPFKHSERRLETILLTRRLHGLDSRSVSALPRSEAE